MTARLKTPILIINFKNYIEASGKGALDLAKSAATVSRKLDVEIAVAPPPPFLAAVAYATAIPVLAQHTDPAKEGNTTGHVVAQIVRSAGARGSLLNHSERRLGAAEVKEIILRLSECGLESVVCARTSEEAASLAAYSPSFVAIEPPELIGSGVAVSKAKPHLVSDSVRAVKEVDSNVQVICGAGIVDGVDVEAALRLGARGILVASGIVKAKSWVEKIRELTEPLVKA